VEEHNQISRPNVEHAIELRPVVTTKLTKLSLPPESGETGVDRYEVAVALQLSEVRA